MQEKWSLIIFQGDVFLNAIGGDRIECLPPYPSSILHGTKSVAHPKFIDFFLFLYFPSLLTVFSFINFSLDSFSPNLLFFVLVPFPFD
jgi:hypothetical protein